MVNDLSIAPITNFYILTNIYILTDLFTKENTVSIGQMQNLIHLAMKQRTFM
jgi:hypothetical protein